TLAGIVSERIGELYPPAVWMGQSLITGKPGGLLLCAVVSLAAGITVIGGIARGFRRICDGLFATTARHDYRMGVLKGRSVMAALWKREQKRYLSSSLYVTNTIVGPLLATILVGAMWMTGVDALQETVDGLLAGSSLSLRVAELIPFLLSAVFCMMTTTSVSISMEGKGFWLIKSLPVSTKMVLDSKILMNLSVMLPFYVVSEILLTLAVRPMLTQWLWQLLIPAVLILFTCVLGITVNLHFYSFDWRREETVVKQSAAALLGGFAGLLVSLLCAVPMILAPQERIGLVKAAICLALSAMTWLLREKNNQTQLQCL
ncbi:MAG: hypothetical protein J6I64_01495, partial [Lachnospiraceae bacterium]|nr:hypothetical protein [Lachnospiraceae bacterium]